LVQHLTRRHGIGRRRDRERGGKPPTPVAPTPTPHVLPDSRFRDTCVARPSRGRSGRCDPRLTARRFPGDYRRLADVWRAAYRNRRAARRQRPKQAADGMAGEPRDITGDCPAQIPSPDITSQNQVDFAFRFHSPIRAPRRIAGSTPAHPLIDTHPHSPSSPSPDSGNKMAIRHCGSRALENLAEKPILVMPAEGSWIGLLLRRVGHFDEPAVHRVIIATIFKFVAYPTAYLEVASRRHRHIASVK